MSAVAEQLPRWDMEVVYPGLESAEFDRDFQAVVSDIQKLGAFFEEHDVRKQERVTVDDATVEIFDQIASRLDSLLARFIQLQAYIAAFVATDSRNARAQASMSELQQHAVHFAQVQTRFTAWLGSMDIETLISRSTPAADLAFVLRKEAVEARHLMTQGEEDLAAELNVSAGSAWNRLHSDISSQLLVPFREGDTLERLPMSVIRSMSHDPDRGTRRRAYEAELEAWQGVAVPLAAALNSIKGQTNTLDRRRGWASPLDVALFNNNIDRATLEAMMDAARAAFSDFRRYLQAKARVLGLQRLAWYDLFAPVGHSEQTWEWQDAVQFLLEQFGTYSPRLRDYAARAFAERWIDAEPRPGKRDGAFCMSLRRDESRILANYRPTYDGMSTLAHELGHGYHNMALAGRTQLQRSTPMTLAETASIFCETIVREAALAQAAREEQMVILEASLQSSCQVVVDITSRFLFESRLFERRLQRELSVAELNELMLQSQRDTYGDGLDPTALHPYMWAAKGHYYSPARSFYNFPYMFGLLFGLGLYARFREDPATFRAGYDDLLSSTGLADAAVLARHFGIDVRTTEFWAASLDVVQADIVRFERLAADSSSNQ